MNRTIIEGGISVFLVSQHYNTYIGPIEQSEDYGMVLIEFSSKGMGLGNNNNTMYAWVSWVSEANKYGIDEWLMTDD